MTDFLPGVPADRVIESLSRAKGNEFTSGKFDSPESSAALVANAFGWFLTRPELLPVLPGVPMGDPQSVALEAEMRFPWRGGRHPWLDVGITTQTTLVGIESKRYEPFRPQKATVFSEAYDSRDWGHGLARYTKLRQQLTEGKVKFRHLDAVQLVKHAYGLMTQASKQARGAVLVYLYAQPQAWANGKPIDPAKHADHEREVDQFAQAVRGDQVVFAPVKWADLLAQWSDIPDLSAHAKAITSRFGAL